VKVEEVAKDLVRANKKKADFQWREWSEHAERTQELYKRASQTQSEATIELGDGKKPILLLPFSDQHIGGRGVDYKIFRRMTEEIIETPGLYVALIGDMTEFAIRLRSVAEVCAQVFGPDKQIQFMEKWFEEIKHKVAFCTWENHETERSEKMAGFSFIKHLVGKESVYFDGIGHADVKVGSQTYNIAASHKFRGYSYMNPCHAGQRYMRFQGIDREIAMMGDIHTPAFMSYFDGFKERLSMVAGTLNVRSLYAMRYFSIFTMPEYPCVELSHDKHEFNPFRNLGTWKRYTGNNVSISGDI
jgi:hypothetical protein